MKSRCAIAIVGIGGIFPGAESLPHFWTNITRGVSASREAPPGRWLLAREVAFAPGPAQPDKVYSPRACFVDGFSITDTPLFPLLDIPPSLVEKLDPLYHLTLFAGASAFEDAVTAPLDRRRIGVAIGNIALPTEKSSSLSWEIVGRTFCERTAGRDWRGGETHPLNRYVTGLPAGLLARALGLEGSCRTVDAACASSLYAVKIAADELSSGRADAMITGGVCRPDPLYTQMGFSQLNALSPDGVCAPFDAQGKGLVVGEGAGMFVLKRLEDAVRHGDRIYAVICGIGLSNDIDGSLLAPSAEGQLRAMRAAYKEAQWEPNDVDIVECHATGTPVGDAVEFKSLVELWGHRTGRCVIGSVKSNVGHLLTGAGAAGLMKMLLAIRERTLPPTANFSKAAPGIDIERSPFRVLTAPEPWQEREAGAPRRAAVSAFGFGGINGHVLLEEWRGGEPGRIHPAPAPQQRVDIAIVGMDAHFGPWESIELVRRRATGLDEGVEPSPHRNWWGVEESAWFRERFPGGNPFRGWFIDALHVTPGTFRIPPKEIEEMLPQQLLMLKVAKGALADGGLQGRSNLDGGLFIGISLDLNTTNFHVRWMLANAARAWAEEDGGLTDEELTIWIRQLRDSFGPPLNANRTMGALGGIVASRIAREFRFGGPSFTLSSEESSGIHALEAAVRALRQREISFALVGAVDLAGDVRALLSSPYRQGEIFGEGAAGVVLKRLDDAVRDGDHVYGIIEGIGSAAGGPAAGAASSAGAERLAVERAHEDGGTDPSTVGFLERSGSCEVARESLTRSTAGSPYVGTTKASLGDTGAASGLASLVRALLCMNAHILPCDGAPAAGAGKGRRYWLRNSEEGPRRCGITATGADGTCTHVVVREHEAVHALSTPAAPFGDTLFAVDGDSDEELLRKLDVLRTAQGESLHGLAREWYEKHPLGAARARAVSLVARARDDLAALVEAAKRLIGGAPRESLRRGSDPENERIFFSDAPAGSHGTIAFVFPGSGNHYAGMGRELSAAFPGALDGQDGESGRLRDQMLPELFWDLDSLDGLHDDHQSLIFGQVTLGTVVADVLRSFAIRPHHCIGYSLGESAGLFALRAWTQRDEMLRRMRASTLFTEDLAGVCRAAKAAWGIAPESPIQWTVGVADAPAEAVRRLIARRKKVYLLIVNTPGECVVGGESKAVKRLIADLGCAFIPLQGVTTVHCDVVKPVEREYRELHLFETTPPEGVAFTSAAWGRTYDVTPERAADSIVAQALAGLDFPKIIDDAYDRGARIFIETGPGASCTRMIGRILAGRPHTARAICHPGQHEVLSLLSLLGALIAERVPVDLSPLYGREIPLRGAPPPPRAITVRIGGAPFTPLSKTAPHASQAVALPPQTAPQSADSHGGGAPAPHGPPPLEPPSPDFPEPLPAVAPIPAAPTPAHAPAPQRQSVPQHAGGGALHPALTFEPVMQSFSAVQAAAADAHETYLTFTQNLTGLFSKNMTFQLALLEAGGEPPASGTAITSRSGNGVEAPSTKDARRPATVKPFLDRGGCLEFAVGSLAKVLGEAYAHVDRHPTRVRLPAEPLMLVDRILSVEGERQSLESGRVVTEHDVLPGAWYLDGDRIPTCIAVEAGQADLFLSGYLGIDTITRGLAVYRLLDAVVTFHRELPQPGAVIHYDIRILHFFRQGDTWLFRFEFDSTVSGEPLLTMRRGCAGFFTEQDLESGKGIVHTELDRRPIPGVTPPGWSPPAPMAPETYGPAQLDALRRGDLAGCFGDLFDGLPLAMPLTIPGGTMTLVDRVTRLDPTGGRFGLGLIRAEADIHPDDWFLTCHFCDDQVMPGTLMYECCMHTLRIFLLRMGWVAESGAAAWQPVPGVASQLKCRGQVIHTTRSAAYEISVREIGYRPEPYAIADALMFADGRPIVEIINMSIRLTGATEEHVLRLWSGRGAPPGEYGGGSGIDAAAGEPRESAGRYAASAVPRGENGVGAAAAIPAVYRKTPIFDCGRILAFATGNPSEAFGEPYRVFDGERVIARLPGPPYQFLDRITAIDAEPWKMVPGGVIEAQYDVPADAWYFAANRQRTMPFAVLLEAALQPCGWLAAYVGSALTSDVDLSFRNLGGSAVQFLPVTGATGTLTTTIRITNVSSSGGMIIQHYDFDVSSRGEPLYRGATYFGFFSKAALAQQVGIRDSQPWAPTSEEAARGEAFPYPAEEPFPDVQFRMIDDISLFVPDGGPAGLGFIRGTFKVRRESWFFKAHFYQDPVIPGSLGLESFFQLMKVAAHHRWGARSFVTPVLGERHDWVYRGQVIPDDAMVTVDGWITSVDDSRRVMTAEGFLSVDGRIIYQMKDFSLEASK